MQKGKGRFRAQSALEYLQTYGIAIIILIIILLVLFKLNVFDIGSLSPRALAGSCQVSRPYGSNTTVGMQLKGICSGELPKFVATFTNQNWYMDAINFSSLVVNSQMSLSFWAYVLPTSPISNWQDYAGISPISSSSRWRVLCCQRTESGNAKLRISKWCWRDYTINGGLISTFKWHYFALTYNGVALSCYMDGKLVASTTASGYITNSMINFSVGYVGGTTRQYANGSIADVQFYNTSLTANEVQALYTGGIGGPPIVLKNLVGWWPLNGDFIDYSGNSESGVREGSPLVGGTAFTNQWLNGYTVP